jgi:hypothetical protein
MSSFINYTYKIIAEEIGEDAPISISFSHNKEEAFKEYYKRRHETLLATVRCELIEYRGSEENCVILKSFDRTIAEFMGKPIFTGIIQEFEV